MLQKINLKYFLVFLWLHLLRLHLLRLRLLRLRLLRLRLHRLRLLRLRFLWLGFLLLGLLYWLGLYWLDLLLLSLRRLLTLSFLLSFRLLLLQQIPESIFRVCFWLKRALLHPLLLEFLLFVLKLFQSRFFRRVKSFYQVGVSIFKQRLGKCCFINGGLRVWPFLYLFRFSLASQNVIFIFHIQVRIELFHSSSELF